MKASKVVVGLLILAISALIPIGSASSASAPSKDSRSTVTLAADNVVVLNDEVNGESVAKVVEAARKLDDKLSLKDRLTGGNKKPIYLFLNTPGGSIQDGLLLIEQLQSLKRPVHTVTLFAASMGFQIAQNLGERYIIKNGVLMSHRAYGGFEGSFGGQSPSPIEGIYGLWMSRLNEMDQQTVDRTKGKQTLESYQKQYAPDMWRTGSEAVKEGYADKVVKVSCDDSLKGVTTHSFMFMGLIPISYDLSNCPMNTTPMNIRVGIRTNKGVVSAKDFTSKAGGFGYACLEAAAKNPEQLCATDLQLTLERVYQAESEFKAQYTLKAKTVIRMKIGY